MSSSSESASAGASAGASAWASAPYTTNGFKCRALSSRETNNTTQDELRRQILQAQEKHDQLVAENAELRRQNQELLAKFEADVKRLEEKMNKSV